MCVRPQDLTCVIIRKSDYNFWTQSAVNPREACLLILGLHVIQKRTTLIWGREEKRCLYRQGKAGYRWFTEQNSLFHWTTVHLNKTAFNIHLHSLCLCMNSAMWRIRDFSYWCRWLALVQPRHLFLLILHTSCQMRQEINSEIHLCTGSVMIVSTCTSPKFGFAHRQTYFAFMKKLKGVRLHGNEPIQTVKCFYDEPFKRKLHWTNVYFEDSLWALKSNS